MAFIMGAERVQLLIDSRLVANQFSRSLEVRDKIIEAYLDVLGNCEKYFDYITITHKLRNKIRHEDALA